MDRNSEEAYIKGKRRKKGNYMVKEWEKKKKWNYNWFGDASFSFSVQEFSLFFSDKCN